VTYDGKPGNYCHCLFLDAEGGGSPAAARSGASRKSSPRPRFKVETDTLLGTLDTAAFGSPPARWGYKLSDAATLRRWRADMAEPIISSKSSRMWTATAPHHRAGALQFEDVKLKGAWTARPRCTLASHALAPVGELPVGQTSRRPTSSPDLTLGLGTVVHD